MSPSSFPSSFFFSLFSPLGLTQSFPDPREHLRGRLSAAGENIGSNLYDFGENNAENINGAGRLIHDGWMNFHKFFDDGMDNGHEMLKDFGTTTGRVLERVPVLGGNLAKYWRNLKEGVDASVDRTKLQLKDFGNRVAGNINSGTRQVGGIWKGTRDMVDSNLGAGIGAVRGQGRPASVATPSVSVPSVSVPSVSVPNVASGASSGVSGDLGLSTTEAPNAQEAASVNIDLPRV